ncbi:uncharacterized protein LOC113509834 isoform X2 [Galleria mellonella]|uniref:Uncharacterized protein LOC113509834 isoform X2 n=1 Tax=Galleria mellonella TaxID=7137 RepID=A0A6J3C4B2_GALME|nr:uncharacterized protein LOC113509834 isoform X2 [Galleria mellonella]
MYSVKYYFITANVIISIVLVYVRCQYDEGAFVKPDSCHAAPELLMRQCCVFPPFFARDVARACGAIFALLFTDKQNNVTTLRRQAITGCDHWRCILKKYNLLTDEEYVDDEQYYNHLDKWVDLNPIFATIMLSAKVHCKQIFKYFMPLKICEFYNFHSCIRHVINLDCPVPINNIECSKQKQFYDECRTYYMRK